MATDMSLGGGAGFAANYTPIRFAPLVSLTGPVMAPATPAAPEASAPMIRPPMMADQSGGYETPQRTDEAFQNLQPIGVRLATPEGRAAELRDLGRGLSFMTSPLMSTASLLATGKMPLDYVLGDMGGAAQPGGQATPAAPFGGFLQRLQDSFARNVFGPEEVSLAGGPSGVDPQAGYSAAESAIGIASNFGLSPESIASAGRTAAGLVAQGMDPTAAAALAANYAAYADRSQMPSSMREGLPTSGASGMLGGTPAGNQLLSDIYGAMQFAPGSTETGPGGTSLSQEGSYEGSYGGGWGPGDTPGGYDTNTGAYSDVTGYE